MAARAQGGQDLGPYPLAERSGLRLAAAEDEGVQTGLGNQRVLMRDAGAGITVGIGDGNLFIFIK